jgi:hypothetical protein
MEELPESRKLDWHIAVSSLIMRQVVNNVFINQYLLLRIHYYELKVSRIDRNHIIIYGLFVLKRIRTF